MTTEHYICDIIQPNTAARPGEAYRCFGHHVDGKLVITRTEPQYPGVWVNDLLQFITSQAAPPTVKESKIGLTAGMVHGNDD